MHRLFHILSGRLLPRAAAAAVTACVSVVIQHWHLINRDRAGLSNCTRTLSRELACKLNLSRRPVGNLCPVMTSQPLHDTSASHSQLQKAFSDGPLLRDSSHLDTFL